MDLSGIIPPQSHHLLLLLLLHPRVPLIHDPPGVFAADCDGAVPGWCCSSLGPSPHLRPGPGTALICSHSSSRQSVKHWGKIFCLPEQLLINCPFIDAQDKFYPLYPPTALLAPHYTLSHFHYMLWSSLSPSSSAPCGLVKLAHSLYLSINYRDARGAARLGQRTSGKRGDGEEEEEEEEEEAARGTSHKVEDKK